jgi:hypothetical protein
VVGEKLVCADFHLDYATWPPELSKIPEGRLSGADVQAYLMPIQIPRSRSTTLFSHRTDEAPPGLTAEQGYASIQSDGPG